MPGSVSAPAAASLIGSLIRERRMALALRQGEVAQAVGISASYLNLIEHNRRRAAPDVLSRLAQVLGTDVAQLSEGAGGALIDDLRTAAAAFPAYQAEVPRLEDFAGRFPGWAALLAAQHRRAGQLEQSIAALNDRLTHDPYLSASLHEVLSALASVRSTAAILADTEDIDADWRARFHRNLHQDSERLAVGAEALVAYLDGSGTAAETGFAGPQDEVEAWLAGRGWHLAELDAPEGAALLQDEIANLTSAAARALAADLLGSVAADAARLPDADLRAALAGPDPDPVLIAQGCGLPVWAVMRRIALLPGSGAGLVICDASGTLLFRKPVEGFALPRFGAACPLWPLFEALAQPMMPRRDLVELAGRNARRFRTLSVCDVRLPQGSAGPSLREAAMLILPEDGPRAGAAGVFGREIGTSCRICARRACPARREPSILAETAT